MEKTNHKKALETHSWQTKRWMMIAGIATILIVGVAILIPARLHRDVPDAEAALLKKKKKQKSLTADLLAQATSIIYKSSNGSVTPRYHYECFITVDESKVNLTIHGGYDGLVVYNEDHAISRADYEQFLNALSAQQIKHTTPRNQYASGLKVSYIKILSGEEVLFDGGENTNLSVANGRLNDAFLALLPDAMREKVDNPLDLLEGMED